VSAPSRTSIDPPYVTQGDTDTTDNWAAEPFHVKGRVQSIKTEFLGVPPLPSSGLEEAKGVRLEGPRVGGLNGW